MFLDYYSGERGKTCIENSHVIRSKEECMTAIQKLGYQPVGDFWSKKNDRIPSGCSIRSGSLKPHFETSPTGLGTGRDDLTPICIIPENTGNFCLIICL